jgi:alpha-glucosidase
MQWDATPNAGFTTGEPWLPLSDDSNVVNVAIQQNQLHSMLSLYRQLIALRRRETALTVGVHVKAEAIGEVLTFRRFHEQRWLTIALNFSDQACTIPRNAEAHQVLISTHLDRVEPLRGTSLQLRANEGLVMGGA